MGRRNKKKPPYRWQAFTHWMNLAFLAAGGVLSVVWDPAIWLAWAPIELGVLWMIPDLPSFRAGVDKQAELDEIARERAYYAKQLWVLQPEDPPSLGERIAGLFTESKPTDIEALVINRDEPSFVEYMEMRRIVDKLHELEQVRGTSISERDIQRFEQVINGYLRYTIGARSLAKALKNMNSQLLCNEIAELDAKAAEAPLPLRAVLLEQKRIKEARLNRIPKLQATLELFRTRADAIVHQLRNIHSQVITDPGMEVNSFLDELVERQEILSDPLSALEADNALREFINPSSTARSTASAKQAAAATNAKNR